MKKILICIYLSTSASVYYSCEKKQENQLEVNDSARILPKANIIYDSMGASTLGTTGTIFSTTGSTTTSNDSTEGTTAGYTPLTIPDTYTYPNTTYEKNNSK